MSATVVTYDRVMGRWEPNSRGRLAQAAMALYAEQGFDQTTTAEIARHAGLTERSFFRHFPDKREVLFYGMDSVRELVVGAITDAPSSAGPMEAVGVALQAVAAMVQETPEFARERYSIVSANAELRERELVKFAEFATAMRAALRDRGVPEPAASLAAETGIALYRVAFARWIGEPGESSQASHPDLSAVLQECTADLQAVVGGRLASSVALS
jgi:AcrR family transcriptional regulator